METETTRLDHWVQILAVKEKANITTKENIEISDEIWIWAEDQLIGL